VPTSCGGYALVLESIKKGATLRPAERACDRGALTHVDTVVTVPPSTIRSNALASVIDVQTPPSASRQIPSGGPSRPSAKIRRSDSDRRNRG